MSGPNGRVQGPGGRGVLLSSKKEWARVHFITALKDGGVFVILRTPEVMTSGRHYPEIQ